MAAAYMRKHSNKGKWEDTYARQSVGNRSYKFANMHMLKTCA